MKKNPPIAVNDTNEIMTIIAIVLVFALFAINGLTLTRLFDALTTFDVFLMNFVKLGCAATA